MKHGAGVLAIKGHQVLLVKAKGKSLQLPDQISFPGGHIETGESTEVAARREFEEETGLIAGKLIEFPGDYVEASVLRKDGMIDFSFKVYMAQEFSGELRTTDETEPFWVYIDEARKIKLFGKNNQILEDAIKFLSNPSRTK